MMMIVSSTLVHRLMVISGLVALALWMDFKVASPQPSKWYFAEKNATPIPLQEGVSAVADQILDSPSAKPSTPQDDDDDLKKGAAFRTNSMAWLQGTRLSNIKDTPEFIQSQILDLDTALLDDGDRLTERSVCHESGTFRKPSNSNNWNVSNEALVEEWTFRLTYLAIHSWHHRPAEQEMKDRLQQGGQEDKEKNNPFNVSRYDFECPDTKFMIGSIPRLGMGASYRMGAVNAIMMGIAINRVTIFLNNVPSEEAVIPTMLQEDLWLASCDRRDMQCAFLPTTPCVVTMEDLVDRMIDLPEGVARTMRRRGMIVNDTLAKHRYLYANSRVNPAPDRGLMSRVRKNLARHAGMLIEAWEGKNGGLLPKEKKQVLDEALRRLGRGTSDPHGDDIGNGAYPYTNRMSFIHHAALLYVMRLRRDVQSEVDQQVNDILAGQTSFDPAQSIGLPIRGSDKCHSESTCLSFDSYTKLAHEVWSDNFPKGTKKGHLVVTTEAVDIVNATRLFHSSQLALVMNKDDVLQDTGRPRTPKFRRQADAIMKSTLVALKLQLQTAYTIGNCCSNFHLVLFDLLRNGCGLGKVQQCLQETKNPDYHVCCSWTRTEECDAMRNSTASL